MAAGIPFGGSPRLRLFLVAGVRLVGVVLALVLTALHTVPPYNDLPAGLGDFPIVITAAVVLYHLAAGFLTFRANSAGLGAILIVMDALMGVALTYFYGPAYLVLGFTLPVLASAFFFGSGAAWMVLLIGALFYGLIMGFAAVSIGNRVDAAAGEAANAIRLVEVTNFLRLAIVEGLATLLLLWLYLIGVGEGEDRRKVEDRSRQEKDLLFQEIQSAKSEVVTIYQEIGSRENTIRQLERENSEVREELEATFKRLHEARLTVQATEKLAEDQGREVSQQARREKMQMQRQLARLQQRLERQNRLVEVFRQVSASLALSDTLLALTEQLQALLPCQTCVIFMIDDVEGHRELFAEVAASPFTDLFRNFSLQLGEGAPGYVASQLEPLKIDEGAVTAGGRELTTVVPEEKSALIAPLATQSDTLGAVYLGRPEEAAFTEDDLEMLAEFCELASISLGNAMLFQRTVTSGIHDPLTSLYNSLYLEERMREEVKRGRRYTYPVSLVLMDIDGFGEINEAFGQEAADTILREVAEIVRSVSRETDVVARLEGDDFAILIVHSDRNSAWQIAERIRTTLEAKTFGRGARKVRVTASLGVAGIPHDAVNEEQLTMRATSALQQSRASGGNTVAFWNGSGA